MDIQQFDIPRYLAALPLFQEMTPAELQRLATGCRLRRYARGDTVFRVGMPCEEFHVTVTGQIKLFAISPTGQEKVIELAGPGVSFGEAVMFMESPYLVTAQTLTDTLLLTIERATVLREIERSPAFSLRMLAGLSRRLQGLVQDVEAVSLHSGMQRVIGYLLHSLPEDGAGSGHADCREAVALNVSLPVSKATIASRLSITPEYFSRVLHELEQAGLIRIDKRDVPIPTPALLASHTLQ